MAKEKEKEGVWKSEYLGSGTFIITKPRRKKNKIRQQKVKCPQAGARK